MGREGFTLAGFLLDATRIWGMKTPRTMWRMRRLQLGLLRSALKRKRLLRRENLLVPLGIGLSPTMRCNLSCEGCYARNYPRDNEMDSKVLDSLVGSAVDAGVFLFVVTGGEPYLREDLFDIFFKYRRAAFLTITNGTCIGADEAALLADAGNVIPVISIEGDEALTDRRRGPGVYAKAMRCISLLRERGVVFGFSAVITKRTVDMLGRKDFVRRMIDAGCSFGFFNDFIPMDDGELSMMPAPEKLADFKEKFKRMREEPIVLVHLPDDEYDEDGRCLAVGGGGMHVNAQGYAEPCPFAHFARENVKNVSFRDVLRSPFLGAIRAHPTVLLHGNIGCSLVNNRDELERIARRTGAVCTDGCASLSFTRGSTAAFVQSDG